MMVDVNVFERLVKEYFEIKGFFLLENVSYGYNREADLLGYNTKEGSRIHVEVTETVPTVERLKEHIEKKFHNKQLNDLYSKHFGHKKVQKIFVVWWYKSSKQWRSKVDIEREMDVTLMSFIDIFEALSKKAEDMKWGDDKNKIYTVIKMFKNYEKHKN